MVICPLSMFWDQRTTAGADLRVLPFCVVASNVNTPYIAADQPFNDMSNAPFKNQ